MTSSLPYNEETFGILTDDNLYLDCILVRPPHIADEELQAIRVWVPKYPLTKSSVITCARQEVRAHGTRRKVAHLVFDLRTTGDSEGVMGDHRFDLDIHAVTEWARERFGDISFGLLGTPTSDAGQVNLWPMRAGSVIESYHYPTSTGDLTPPTLLYLATYGNFSRADDLLCTRLSQLGFEVFGVDPLRYLLHASVNRRLKPEDLWDDMQQLVQMLPGPPIILAQPVAAGLAVLWASQISKIRGVVAVGKAQAGFSPGHIFANSNPYTFLLSRYAKDLAPRPFALVQIQGHPLGGDDQEMKALSQSSKQPHHFAQVEKLSLKLLSGLLEWVQQHAP